MMEIPYEPISYYVFDRCYNNFKMLYKYQYKNIPADRYSARIFFELFIDSFTDSYP